ncbi:hypothetical protein DNTS_017890, partial [Danionella cerebrum]
MFQLLQIVLVSGCQTETVELSNRSTPVCEESGLGETCINSSPLSAMR